MSGRGASAAVLTETAKGANQPFHLVQVVFDAGDGGPIYMTDLHRAVSFGGHTYLANGEFLQYEALEESAELKVTEATLSLSGVDQVWIAYLLTLQYLGRTAIVYKGFVDSSDTLIVDPIAILQGPMDAPEISEDPSSGAVKITVKVTSLGADLNAPSGFHSNLNEHQVLFPGDMGFQFAAQVAGLLASRSVFWGAQASPAAAPTAAVEVAPGSADTPPWIGNDAY